MEMVNFTCNRLKKRTKVMTVQTILKKYIIHVSDGYLATSKGTNEKIFQSSR